MAPGERTPSRKAPANRTGTGSPTAAYRVVWGLGRYEDFPTAAEADARASEIHEEMVETWPLLAGSSDGSLPRVIEVQS